MWWRFVHEAARAPGRRRATPPQPIPAGRARRPRPTAPAAGDAEEEKEDAELAAYNDYLAQLAEQDQATGR